MRIIRLSGLLADRPEAAAAQDAFYFALPESQDDRGVVYESDGVSWLVRNKLDRSDIVSRTGGALADRPVPESMVGWIYHATDNDVSYEAFPGGWFELSTELEDIAQWTPEGISFFGVAHVVRDIGDGQSGVGVDNIVSGTGDMQRNIDVGHRRLCAEDGDTDQLDYHDPTGVILSNRPDGDPLVTNMIYRDANGFLKISDGPPP